MKTAELEILNLADGRIVVCLKIFDFQRSGKPVRYIVEVVDTLKIINPVLEELDWERQIILTERKEK